MEYSRVFGKELQNFPCHIYFAMYNEDFTCKIVLINISNL